MLKLREFVIQNKFLLNNKYRNYIIYMLYIILCYSFMLSFDKFLFKNIFIIFSATQVTMIYALLLNVLTLSLRRDEYFNLF